MQVEGSIAVSMVSVTAFRSVFVSEVSKASRKKAIPWYSSTVAKLRRRNKELEEEHKLEGLPAIPSATLSGMRTFIRGSQLGFVSDHVGGLDDCELLHSTDRSIHDTI